MMMILMLESTLTQTDLIFYCDNKNRQIYEHKKYTGSDNYCGDAE